jgi:hypothetical protein
MLKDVTKFLTQYVSLVLLLPVVIAIIRRTYLQKELRAIAFYLILSIIFQVVSFITARRFHTNNLPYLHLYTILEFSVISWFYYLFLGAFVKSKLIWSMALGFAIFAIINAFFIQSIFEINTFARGLESILVVFYCILAFYKMLQSLEATNVEKSPQFWINAGFLLYFAGSLFLFILGNLILTKDIQLSLLSWAIHACLVALMYIFLAVGLWYSPRR